jgi:AraC-like DNA-binding protein
LTRHILELIGATISTNEQWTETRDGTARSVRLEAIRADILQNLSKMQLSAKTVARRHGITSRYVHLLFRQTGQTFSQFVEEARLRRAMALLSDPMCAELKIGDIASRVGYAEHSTFYRAFRRYFGEAPGRVRKLSRAQHRRTLLPLDNDGGKQGAASVDVRRGDRASAIRENRT